MFMFPTGPSCSEVVQAQWFNYKVQLTWDGLCLAAFLNVNLVGALSNCTSSSNDSFRKEAGKVILYLTRMKIFDTWLCFNFGRQYIWKSFSAGSLAMNGIFLQNV